MTEVAFITQLLLLYNPTTIANYAVFRITSTDYSNFHR